ncbi:PTS glucitol/sorbitol transporter subunit IIA [Vagococcus salmoninarum]|uniref:PTS glucitol/sorbitol transporter subunit IIA n=1 Tax=Vagococcus salmoninarum TaxID=2739 RepID=UPI001FD562A1|nr:PTS glucitol/sorbitol transporter subunit IIA [Vagococcus salmoninarum]
MIQGKVIEIGEQAVDAGDQMIILFGESATPELKKVSVIQTIDKSKGPIKLGLGGHLSFDEQRYTMTHLGRLAESQLNEIGHVTVIFSEVPSEDALVNAIYVEPFILPEIKTGTIIKYN